ncbi:MAG: MFS transporter [Salinirussus sp.]
MVTLRSLFGEHAVILRETNYQLLIAATVLPILGTSLLSPVLDTLTGPYATSAADIGLLISAYSIPHVFAIPLVGVLTDRYGRKPLLVAGLVVFGIGGVAMPLTTNFELALALRLLQGVGGAGLNPVIIIAIGDLYAGNREETGQGLRFAASGLSGAVLPLAAGVIVAIGWQLPFLLYALAFPVAAMVFAWMDEPTDVETTTDGGSRRAYRRELAGLFRHNRVRAMAIARVLPPIAWFAFITYNSIVIVRLLGSTPAVAGLMTSVASLVFALVASQAGRVTAAFDSRFYPLIGGNICLGVGTGLLALAPSVSVVALGVAILGIGNGITLSLYRSIMTDLAPQDLRGGLVSLTEAGGWLAATLAPVILGTAIAAGTATLGFRQALQLSILGTAILVGVGGIICMIAVRTSAPVTVATNRALE